MRTPIRTRRAPSVAKFLKLPPPAVAAVAHSEIRFQAERKQSRALGFDHEVAGHDPRRCEPEEHHRPVSARGRAA